MLKHILTFLLLNLAYCNCELKESRVDLSLHGESNKLSLNFTHPDNGLTQLSVHLGISLPEILGQPTQKICDDEPESECFEYGDFAKLKIRNSETSGCSHLEWSSIHAKRLEDCFDILENAHWYGGAETYVQTWPIESNSRPEGPFVTGDSIGGEVYGSVLENYWLVSTGISIHVDETVPLFVSINSTHPNQICIVSESKAPYQPRTDLHLSYTICPEHDIKAAHLKQIEAGTIGRPSGIPDEKMFLNHFWSTWAEYKHPINQSVILDLAHRIIDEGFVNSSHIEIDDNWEACYGEAEFDSGKFPDVAGMVEEIKSLGFRVTLWVQPFINSNCPSFLTALQNGYFIKDQKGKPAISHWQTSGMVDFTNPDAASWWKDRLTQLKTKYGIDSFKFDYGEVNWHPPGSTFTGVENGLFPNAYSAKYVEEVSSFGGLIEVRTGRGTQRYPIFTRILDRDTRWGYDAGLKSVIPTVLHFGILGYPFALPDMIGGSANGVSPTGELFVRWLQMNVFMPSVQFSVLPWHYGSEVVQITKNMLSIREKYKDHIIEAAQAALDFGYPINRPLWWLEPENPQTFSIDSQYMLGGKILVAPVLEEGAITRAIYIPDGTWMDGNTNEIISGPTNLDNYNAPVEILPFFILQN